MTDLTELARRLAQLDKLATPGPWATESCGEKGDGAYMLGVVYGPDDEMCNNQLDGHLKDADDDGNFIEYYRDELVAEFDFHNRHPYHDATLVMALRNSVPTLLRALAVQEATEAIEADDHVIPRRFVRSSINKRADELLAEWTR